MSMTPNIGMTPHSAQGSLLRVSDRERMARVIYDRACGETWSHRYSPAALLTYSELMAEMREPMDGQLAQVASLLGCPEKHLRYYYGGMRPMSLPLFVTHFSLTQREPLSQATDRGLMKLAALKGQAVGTLPQGDPAEIRRALKDAMDQFTAFAGTVLMALEDDTIVPHEVTDIALWYRRHQDGSSRLMACVIAAEKAAR